MCVVTAVGSHQATLKELSRVRHELLKAKAVQASMEQQMMPETDCTEALSSYHVDQEPRDDAKLQDALRQSEKSVSVQICIDYIID